MIRIWWLLGGDSVALCQRHGDSVVRICWLTGGYMMATWQRCGGSMAELW